MAKVRQRKLGDILVEAGVITTAQLREALARQKATGKRIADVLVELGFTTTRDIIRFVGVQLGIPCISLDNYFIDSGVTALVPESMARKYHIIPVSKSEDALTVAMADPLDVFAIDDLQRQTGLKVEPAVCTEEEVGAAIDQYYGIKESVEEVMRDIDEELFKEKETVTDERRKLEELADEVPIVKLVNLLIMEAVKDRASDIHIEPDRDSLRTRYRVDGILHEVTSPSKRLQLAITSRVKIMAGVDIAEKRIPQDGRFRMRVKDKDIDVRVSTLPTMFGEKVVMRILDRSAMLVDMDKIGFLPETLDKFTEVIKRPYGIILVTGPTGCGKTSTLYAALNMINSPELNIITIEDPIEYQVVRVNQVQINPKAGLTFASGLRSFLRQDPDIIMVGEVRDLETAEIAIHASLTGHLVFSTLHTNDAPGAFTRLIDMGAEPFLVSSAVTAVMAQRLVRVICPACKQAYRPPKEILESVGLPKSQWGNKFYKGKGCGRCKKTGYLGRTGIFELMIPNERIREMLVGKPSTSELRQAALEAGMKSLRQEGLPKALNGTTTLEEILRVTQEEEYEALGA